MTLSTGGRGAVRDGVADGRLRLPAPVRTVPAPVRTVRGRVVPLYRCSALAGVAAAVGVTVVLCWRAGLPATVWAVAPAAAGAAALLALLARIWWTGSGDLVWSEHELAVLVALAGVGAAAGHPLPLLDAGAVGLLVLHGCGRLGCLLAGCCHGRPARASARLAVRYGPAHADTPVGRALLGVPLVPVQAYEAGWCLIGLAAAGSCLAADVPAGAPLVAALGARAAGRVVLEPMRGDVGRRRTRGGTRPQRWAAAVAAALLVATAAGMLPLGLWTLSPAAALVALTALTAAASLVPRWVAGERGAAAVSRRAPGARRAARRPAGRPEP